MIARRAIGRVERHDSTALVFAPSCGSRDGVAGAAGRRLGPGLSRQAGDDHLRRRCRREPGRGDALHRRRAWPAVGTEGHRAQPAGRERQHRGARRRPQADLEVLNELKPGLDEKLYERAMFIELNRRGHTVSVQSSFPVFYRAELIGNLIPDLIVDDAIIVDPKVVSSFTETHVAQMIGYLNITGLELALLINF